MVKGTEPDMHANLMDELKSFTKLGARPKNRKNDNGTDSPATQTPVMRRRREVREENVDSSSDSSSCKTPVVVRRNIESDSSSCKTPVVARRNKEWSPPDEDVAGPSSLQTPVTNRRRRPGPEESDEDIVALQKQIENEASASRRRREMADLSDDEEETRVIQQIQRKREALLNGVERETVNKPTETQVYVENDDTDNEDIPDITRETTPANSAVIKVSIVDRIKNSLSPGPPSKKNPAYIEGSDKFIGENGKPDIDKLFVDDDDMDDMSCMGIDELDGPVNNLDKHPNKDVERREKNETRESRSREQARREPTQPNALLKPPPSPKQSRKCNKSSNDNELREATATARREKSVTRALSQTREVPKRGTSQIRELTVPRELLPLAEGLLRMSVSEVSEELKMSCTDLVSWLPKDSDGIEAEKDKLLKRLEVLIDQEKKQVTDDLDARTCQLHQAKKKHKAEFDEMTDRHREEEEEMKQRQSEEKRKRTDKQSAEEFRLEAEVRSLNEKLESISIPMTFLPLSPTVSTVDNQKNSALSELEAELQCCGCGKICSPPTKIYQCCEGDLLCEGCRNDNDLLTCPACEIPLQGKTSRNKVLENLAKKHFK